MDAATIDSLRQINRTFYSRFAGQFAGSRSHNQPGLLRLIPHLPPSGRLLDVGCGNGRLARVLHQQGRRLAYLGIDSSPELLAIARSESAPLAMPADFAEIDVASPGWIARLPHQTFDAVVALAVLHHVPGWQGRIDLLIQLASLLDGEGVLALSTWQFLNEARLRRKIVPWRAAGLTAEQVEPGDYLLDWQRGGAGLRYCHLVDDVELAALAEQSGLSVHATYLDDGRSHNLNLFAVLRPRI